MTPDRWSTAGSHPKVRHLVGERWDWPLCGLRYQRPATFGASFNHAAGADYYQRHAELPICPRCTRQAIFQATTWGLLRHSDT